MHVMIGEGAGLEVFEALVEVHPESVQLPDEVREGAAWETVGLWMRV